MTAIVASRRRLGSRAALATLLLVVPSSLWAQGLTPEQVVQLETVSGAALSPDGEWVAYTVSRTRGPGDPPGTAWSNLFVIRSSGGDARAIAEGPVRVTSPLWSPDGSYLGFLARLEGQDRTQVYVVPAEGGEPHAVTSSESSVSSFAWSPGGDAIAWAANRSTDPSADARGIEGNDVVVWSRHFKPVRLWVQPIDGRPRPITPEDLDVRAYAWHPSGGRLAVQMTEQVGPDGDLMFRKLYTVSALGGTPALLTPTEGKLGDMAWSPEGTHLAFLGATSFNDPIAQSVFVVSADGASRNLVEGFEGSAASVFWIDDETVGFVAQEGTRTAVNRVAVDGGAPEGIVGGGAEVFTRVSVERDGRRFAAAASTARHPAEVFLGSLNGETGLARLTTHNEWLADVDLGEQETIAWMAEDGLPIEGVLIRPVGEQPGLRYPLAILPHGGPEGVDSDGWKTRALYPAQVLAGRGYAVLMPNYRGSGGRGVAYSKADHRDLGGKEFDDVIAGIDHLAEIGLVDPDRVGISGTSYGGYFSAWAATRHSDRFKVAIPFAGLTNMTAFMGTTDIPVEMQAVHFDLYWNDNPGVYWDRSPVAHSGEDSTPTLIGHGLADTRVHPEQSLELYTALKLAGVPTELVLYPREPHALNERAHQLDYMGRILEWMDRYLQPEGRPVTQP